MTDQTIPQLDETEIRQGLASMVSPDVARQLQDEMRQLRQLELEYEKLRLAIFGDD